jgi:uncharacterized membrane protein YidH (DUF202 family)
MMPPTTPPTAAVLAATQTPGPGGVTFSFHTGTVVLLLALATVVLGLYISYQAYRGYRRNQSRPMLFLAVGIVLLTFVPAVFSTLGANVQAIAGETVLLGFLSRLAGLLSILYGINYA